MKRKWPENLSEGEETNATTSDPESSTEDQEWAKIQYFQLDKSYGDVFTGHFWFHISH